MRISAFFVAVGVTLPWICQGQTELNLTPSRAVGQPTLQVKSPAPNVPERRSLNGPYAVVVDTSSTPPAIFVSDTFNNRVLGWRSATQFSNGAPADLVLGQLDDQSTTAYGPGTARTTGFTAPGGMAIDQNGNLYVIDMANNRILRFSKPFANNDEIKTPNLVIGQPNFTSNTANNGGISQRSIATNSGGAVATSGLAFDAQGNLWFSDPQNNRALRYPKSVLDAGQNGPAADLVLGEPDFRTNTAPNNAPATGKNLNKAILQTPSGITTDSDGRVYVVDALNRVVVFTPPYFNGKEGVRVLGLFVPVPDQEIRPEYLFGSAEGLTMMGNNLVVVDRASRLLRFAPFAEWAPETAEVPSPPAQAVLGQADFATFRQNRGLPEPSALTVSVPTGAFAVGSELYVVDSGNNRVSVFPSFGPNSAATRVLGQTAFNFNAPNIVEGREMFLHASFNSAGLSDGGGIAIDNRSNPPHLYVADTYNNRILGYRDARAIRPNDLADIVIGQNDLNRVLVNAPQNSSEVLTDSGLYHPTGLIVDTNGDLFVADSANGRVLRFASPFEQTIAPGERYRANLVIGQRDANSKVTDPSRSNMAFPFGVGLTVERHLVVSDAVHNRVLFFRRPAGGDFTNGMGAEKVIGQPDFFTVAAGNGSNRMSSPRHLALDTDDRLYVTDGGNSRVLIFDRVPSAPNDPSTAFTIAGLQNAQGVWVSPLTGEIWIANTRAAVVQRYPRFDRLTLGVRSDYQMASNTPLALTQDSSGALFVAEAVNRAVVFYNGLRTQIAGSYAERPLSPGAIGIVYPRSGVTFASETKTFDSLPNPIPLPKDLADVQVLLNDRALPLYFVSTLR